MTAPILSIRHLCVGTLDLSIVDRVSFDLGPGEILGLVGESGSGKSMTCRAIMRLLPSVYQITGEVLFGPIDIVRLPEEKMRRVRGRGIGMIFQDPASHLDPVMKIGDQISEGLRLEGGASRREARAAAIDLLRQVGIPDPTHRIDDYPHQFSGGMRQRAMIAVALACRPLVLFADEPTTALDVVVQAQVLRLLKDIRDKTGLAIVLVSHDLGVIAQTCDRVAVMYAGRLCEIGAVVDILHRPVHPYTAGLVACQTTLRGAAFFATIPGLPPSTNAMPGGCRFHPRCSRGVRVCAFSEPTMRSFSSGTSAACHAPLIEAHA
jgi:peptide/nickel transport system ATP-binding protein